MLLLLAAAPQQEDRRPAPYVEVTPETQAAIERGLQFLASQQTRQGNIPGTVPVASTSMACLCFLASGSTPVHGPYAENIRRGLGYLRRVCSKSGFFTCPGQSGMYGQGFATLFVAEAVGMLRDLDEIEETQEVLRRAVRLLERTQNRFGGWNAVPDGNAQDDGSGAVAIMQITALRAARNAGVQVDEETIRKAKKYVGEMTSKDGWYAYNYHMRGSNQASSALTGAGMYMLGAMDLYTEDRYEKGIANLMNNAPFLKGRRGNTADRGWSGWWYYTAFYASLAIFQRGGSEWREWYPAMREELMRRQARNGGWPDDPYGGLFSAFGLLTMELPLRSLPFLQEGGRGAEGE